MLIFSRRETEQICLGDDIVLTVVKVAGDKVRVGVKAPSHVTILRNELEKNSERSSSSVKPIDDSEIASVAKENSSQIVDRQTPKPSQPASTTSLRVVTGEAVLREEAESKVDSTNSAKRAGPLAGFRRAA